MTNKAQRNTRIYNTIHNIEQFCTVRATIQAAILNTLEHNDKLQLKLIGKSMEIRSAYLDLAIMGIIEPGKTIEQLQLEYDALEDKWCDLYRSM